MATISQRGPYQWQAKIRRRGFPSQSKTFETKKDAERWARDIESKMDRRAFVPLGDAEKTTLREALERYLKEVTPTKKGAKQEANRIKNLMETRLAEFSLTSLRSADIAEWRNELVEASKAPTTIRNLATIISQVFETARVEWHMEGLANPVRGVPMPAHKKGRDRRLSQKEEDRLFEACSAATSTWITPIVTVALETAMRQGEILSLRREDIHGKLARLRDTKNGRQRDVPLSRKALAVLADLPRSLDSRVFPVSQDSLEYHFRKAVKAAEIENFRFHDLRHEATSRLFEAGFSMMEVASITGHEVPLDL